MRIFIKGSWEQTVWKIHMNTALMKILIPMLLNQLKTNTNSLVALQTNTGLKAQEQNEPTAGSYAVEDTGTGKDEEEAGGDCNSKLEKEEYK